MLPPFAFAAVLRVSRIVLPVVATVLLPTVCRCLLAAQMQAVGLSQRHGSALVL